MNKLVLVVGTGRSGSTSVSHLLSRQHSVHVTHERYGHKVRWDCPPSLWPFRLWCDTISEDENIAGDSSFYWTPHIGTFFGFAEKSHREVVVVGIKRPREQVIESYCKWVGEKNHWQYHDGESWTFSKWDHCYPRFTAETRRKAIGRFWDYTYSIISNYARHTEEVELFDISELNTESGVKRVLSHVGIKEDDQVVEVGVKENAMQ